jgi:hypothetical protein
MELPSAHIVKCRLSVSETHMNVQRARAYVLHHIAALNNELAASCIT